MTKEITETDLCFLKEFSGSLKEKGDNYNTIDKLFIISSPYSWLECSCKEVFGLMEELSEELDIIIRNLEEEK